MGTATHLVLCRQHGENSTTARDPIAVWRGQVDLGEKVTCCLHADDDRLVEVPRYEVRAVELPDWLPVEEWIADPTEWKYVWGAGVKREWPETWQRGLAKLGFEDRYWIAKLLAVKNFRSAFRKSLRDQVVAWLETPAAERTWKRPLSPKQMGCLEGPVWEARRAEEGLYRSRGAVGQYLAPEEAVAAVAEVAAA